ncbi:MAG: hypothetical protein Q8922_05720 [Bacteroidota bacterium]|nr:hypothetical protein [Bacteroidota bacterium]MDP4233098.1 hypothetical protein [Bacteroidota bacterium]MDP4241757.1 hypothetical protein [Bacteroidota bacterium]MDP4287415.1 hypothetical protein [Bacteroidota bacterium]
MKRVCWLISLLLILNDMGSSSVAKSQSLRPYVGISSSFGGVAIRTWSGVGVEAGARFGMIFGGLQYGSYGPVVTDPDAWYARTNSEVYYGFDLGIIVMHDLWLGADILESHPSEIEPSVPTIGGSVSYNQSWWNIGPDVRLECWDHALFGIAYTSRRGLKTGCAFVF